MARTSKPPIMRPIKLAPFPELCHHGAGERWSLAARRGRYRFERVPCSKRVREAACRR